MTGFLFLRDSARITVQLGNVTAMHFKRTTLPPIGHAAIGEGGNTGVELQQHKFPLHAVETRVYRSQVEVDRAEV